MTKQSSGSTPGPADLLTALPRGDLWVFGYGSLMWAPGFRYRESSVGLLHGYRRALCVLSVRFRGTPERPGLVLGLERGGSCRGIAFRVARRSVSGVLAALWQREMSGRAYVPRLARVTLQDGRRSRVVRALVFAADLAHPQYAGHLDLRGTVALVAQGVGQRGTCVDYLHNTLAHMRAMGMRDRRLDHVLEAARARRARASAD